MNSVIAAVVGGILSTVTLLGGVNAYQGEPEGVSSDQLYKYGNK